MKFELKVLSLPYRATFEHALCAQDVLRRYIHGGDCSDRRLFGHFLINVSSKLHFGRLLPPAFIQIGNYSVKYGIGDMDKLLHRQIASD